MKLHTRFMFSLIGAMSSLLISSAPSLGASLSFTPAGNQRDGDAINDVITKVGDL